MRATSIRPYRCLCIECESLPPIEGLHPLTYGDTESEARKPKGFFDIIAERVMPSRRQS